MSRSVLLYIHLPQTQPGVVHCFFTLLWTQIRTPGGFMGLAESRVNLPVKAQIANLTTKKSSWSYLMPLFSFGMGNCLEWPLRAVRLSSVWLTPVIHRLFEVFCGKLTKKIKLGRVLFSASLFIIQHSPTQFFLSNMLIITSGTTAILRCFITFNLRLIQSVPIEQS